MLRADEAFIDSLYNAVEKTVKEPGWRMLYTERIVRDLLPLFAARVAAIEAQLDVYRGHCDHLARAERAEADLTAAQERIADLSTACRDGNRGCCVDGTCCACCDRAQRAEERVAAERKQAAALSVEPDFSIPPHAFIPGNAASPTLNTGQCGFPHVFADGPDYCCLEKFHLLHRWGRGSEINP